MVNINDEVISGELHSAASEMKLILALGLIVIQAAVSSGRSVSKSLTKTDNTAPNKNNIADLILPFLNDQDGNDHNILEVVPYGKNNKKNTWKDLKRVAAIGKKEKKKTPLAIILTASNMKGLKKNNNANKFKLGKRHGNPNVDMSFVMTRSDEESSEAVVKIIKKNSERSKLANHLKNNDKNNKQSVDLKLDELTDIDSVSIDNKEEVIEIGEVANSEDSSASDSAPKIDNKEKSLVESNSEPDVKAEDNINASDNIENESNASINSGDISTDDSSINDDATPTIYVVEAESPHSKKHSHDKSTEIELHLAESLEGIDELKKYTLKRKHDKQNDGKILSETISKEKSNDFDGSADIEDAKRNKIEDDEDRNIISEKSEQNKQTDVQIDEITADEKIEATSNEVIKIEDEVDLNADSEVIASVSSNESKINEESNEDSNNLEATKRKIENSNELQENNKSESEPNNSNIVADDNESEINAAVSTENNSYGSDESTYSQEVSNEFNDIPQEENYNYAHVNEVIEEMNEDLIKEIEESGLNAEIKDVDCDNNSKNAKDKDSRKLYNLSFVFNRKK